MTISASMTTHPLVRGSRPVRVALAVSNVAAIAGLTALTITDGPQDLSLIGQAGFVALFAALAWLDLRAAAALALLELVIGGSAGQWTTFPGGFRGRLVMDAIVMTAAAASLAVRWSRGGTLDLGRYGPHAALLAVVIPAVWMTLGLVNGNRMRDVLSDGNAHVFFAFTLVFVVLVKSGQGPWLRDLLFTCCALNAILITSLVVLSVTGIVPIEPTLREMLVDRLGMGNRVGYVEDGKLRLFLASGLYLQVGMAMAVGMLLSNWRRPLVWAVMVLLITALIASYTRGLWVGAAVAVLVVLLLQSQDYRQPARVVGGLLLMMMAASAVGYGFGFSLPDYILNRTASITDVTGQAPVVPGVSPSLSPSTGSTSPPASTGSTSPPASTGPRPVETSTPPPPPGSDTSGPVSNAIRLVQARILLGHIAERPIIGWGFGTIAPDYPYESIPSYELAFLDLAYKTGLVGLALWLSYPVRMLVALTRARLRRTRLPDGLPPTAAATPVAIILSVLASGSTNPYVLASYGLLPIVWAVVWLEPSSRAMKAEPVLRDAG